MRRFRKHDEPTANEKDRQEIISLPNPILRQPSSRIEFISPEIGAAIKTMVDQAKAWEDSHDHEIAVGLAAVQVGYLWRVIIIRNTFDANQPANFYPLINPKIAKFSSETETRYEGCLSVPDCYARVERAKKIRFEAIDPFGSPVRGRIEGFLARVIQHEVDHLKGIMTVDRVKNPATDIGRLNEDGLITPMSLAEVQEANILDP